MLKKILTPMLMIHDFSLLSPSIYSELGSIKWIYYIMLHEKVNTEVELDHG